MGNNITNLGRNAEKQLSEFEENAEFIVNQELDREITMSELDQSIKHLKNGKATGHDNILNEYIKNCSIQCRVLILKLFNYFFDRAYFPDKWAICEIIPIYKKR